mmetsp:Transcript_106905/g.289727  ORF Transcript_106905/g.289727 Transcript_106905/m.289727 type:complete len:238 (-) Transcript_106905:365-1078(-)
MEAGPREAAGSVVQHHVLRGSALLHGLRGPGGGKGHVDPQDGVVLPLVVGGAGRRAPSLGRAPGLVAAGVRPVPRDAAAQVRAPVGVHVLAAGHGADLPVEELREAAAQLPAALVAAVEEAEGGRLHGSGGDVPELLLVHQHDADPQAADVALLDGPPRGDEPAPRRRSLRTGEREAVPGGLVVGLHVAGLVEKHMVGGKAGAYHVGAGVQHVPLVLGGHVRHQNRVLARGGDLLRR